MSLRSKFALALALLVFVPQLHAQSRSRRPGTQNPEEPRTPWKYVQGDAILHDKPITLYWLPASTDDLEHSPLMTSAALIDATSRCVDLEVVLPAQAAAIAKLGMTGKTPAALLVDHQGKVIRTVENVHGKNAAKDVERMLAAELDAREEAMYRDMTAANQYASTGNRAAAVELYEKIWNDRCLFSTAGAEAQRALARLGVIVKEEPAPPPPDPNLKPKATPPAN